MVQAASRLDEQPSRRAEPAYLLGCHFAAAGDFASAARMFQCAFHDDDAYSTACVLVFACLKQQVRPGEEFLDHVLESWGELKRPALLRSERERALLERTGWPAEAAADLPDPLLAALRRVPIARLRRELDERVGTAAAGQTARGRSARTPIRAAGEGESPR